MAGDESESDWLDDEEEEGSQDSEYQSEDDSSEEQDDEEVRLSVSFTPYSTLFRMVFCIGKVTCR